MKKLLVPLLLALVVVMAGCIQFGPANSQNKTHVVSNTTNTTNVQTQNTSQTAQAVSEKLVWSPASGIAAKVQPILSYLKVLSGGNQTPKLLNAQKEKNTGVYRLNVTLGNNTLSLYISPDMKSFWLGSNMRKMTGKNFTSAVENFLESLASGAKATFSGTRPGKAGLKEYDFTILYNGRKYFVPVLRFGDNIIYPTYRIMSVFSPNKTTKPQVDLYIMAFCPFGRQAAAAMAPVEKALGKYANITVHYVIYPASMYGSQASNFCVGGYCSMHGINETREDMRQLCIQKYYPSKYWDYLYAIASNQTYTPQDIQGMWQSVASKFGINTTKIEQCVKNEGVNLLKKEYELDQKYHVSGSPTIFINGMQWGMPRTPQAFQWAVCQAFKNKPAACNETINAQVTELHGSCG